MKLNAKELSAFYTGKRIMPPGRYSDGRNLYLHVSSPTAASWIYMININGRRQEMGLGSFMGTGRAVRLTLSDARLAADRIRSQLARGEDPFKNRRKKTAPTFAVMLESYLAKEAISWKGDGNEKQWRQAFAKHCKRLLQTRVNKIDTPKVLEAVKPIWRRSIGDTMRLRIETVLDHARVLGHRRGDNPARWDGHLEHILPPKTEKGQTNFAALTGSETRKFFAKLADQRSDAARALELIILTAVRAKEATEAWWSEFDFDHEDGPRWEIPAARMKGNKRHIVPLSRQAVALLKPRYEQRTTEFVFAAQKDQAKPLASSLINELIWRMDYKGKATIHGFRSTFRDWAGDETGFDREAIEFCLAHKIGDKVEAAYRRGSAVAKRAAIMQGWADYVCCVSNVVLLPVKVA